MTAEETRDEIDGLKHQVIQLQIDNLKKDSTDHEERIRGLEITQTRFNFLMSLTIGGGILSAINLFLMITT